MLKPFENSSSFLLHSLSKDSGSSVAAIMEQCRYLINAAAGWLNVCVMLIVRSSRILSKLYANAFTQRMLRFRLSLWINIPPLLKLLISSCSAAHMAWTVPLSAASPALAHLISRCGNIFRSVFTPSHISSVILNDFGIGEWVKNDILADCFEFVACGLLHHSDFNDVQSPHHLSIH